MREFQLVNLADLALVGDPVPLPSEFANLSDAVVSDFSAYIDPPPVGYAGKGLFPLILSPPVFDPAAEADTGVLDPASRTVDAAARVVRATTGKRALPPPSKADLVAYAERTFNALRDGGVTLANGLRIKTDGESRGLISGAYSLADVRPDLVIDFRASGGWVNVDTATMQTVAVAVGLWVQACYSGWRGAEELIAAGALTTFADIDAAAAAVTLPS